MRFLLATLATAAALGLPACGGDDDGGEGRTVTVPGDQPIAIAGDDGDDYIFDPENVVVTGSPSSIEIEFENRGSLAHNVRVFKGDDELGGSPTFGGGQTRSASVQIPEPGEYELICTVGNHEQLGMTGTLEVR